MWLHYFALVWKVHNQLRNHLCYRKKVSFKCDDYRIVWVRLWNFVDIQGNIFYEKPTHSKEIILFFEYNEWQFQSQTSMSRIIRNLPIPSKVHIFWEGHKILRNIHCRFVLCSASQIYGAQKSRGHF